MFDGEHIGVAGGSGDEAFDARLERLVGVVEEDVAFSDDGEDVGFFVGEDGGDDRLVVGELEVGAFEAGDLGEVLVFERAWAGVDILFGKGELVSDEVEDFTARGFGDFDTDSLCKPSELKLALDGFIEIV